MKALKVVLTAALTVTMLFSQVLAVESPVKGDGPKVISAKDSTGKDITEMIVTTRMGTSSSIDKINDYLSSARNDISAADEDPAALKGTDGVALGEKLRAEAGDIDFKFAEVFDASMVEGGKVISPNGSVTITYEYSAPADVPFFVLHQVSSGAWQIVKASVSGNTVTVTTGGLSPFAFVTGKTAAKAPIKDGGDGKTTSPQTGEYVTRYVLLAAAALMVAGVVCVKRAKKSSAK